MRTFARVLVLAGLLDGCTTNTPQQDYIYDMARPCEGKGIRLDYVSPDGQQWRGLAIHPSSSMPEFAPVPQRERDAHAIREVEA